MENNFPTDFWNQRYNCSYTTATGQTVKLTLEVLLDTISKLPKVPKIITMPIEVIRSGFLPENYMIVSKGVADALEEAFKENPQPMYCAQHGGNEVTNRFNKTHGFNCPKCVEENF